MAAVIGGLAQPPALILVEGEAGTGKTRLVGECLKSGEPADHIVLVVQCHPLAEPVDLGPVVDGVRRLRPSIAGVRLGPLAGALRPLFPEWGADLPASPQPLPDARQSQWRVYRALSDLLDRLGVDVLVFEDAQWADTASQEWLLTVTTYDSPSRSVVVTYRRHEMASSSLLRRLISRIPARMTHVRIMLDPLTVTGIQQLARSMPGVRVSDEFATFLHDRTGGLPLAVVESLRLLRDRGDIAVEGDGWARRVLVELRAPPVVRDSVLDRVGRLAPAVQRVLEAAAVLAEPADETLLAAVAGLEPPAVEPAVSAGWRTGLLVGQGRRGWLGLRHRLAAEAIEDSLPAGERQRMHQRAAEVLQAAGGVSPARLYRHFTLAGDFPGRSRYAEATADLAAQTGDDRTAVTVLHDLLTTVEHAPAERARLAAKLGQAAVTGTALLGDQLMSLIDALREVLADGTIAAGQRGEIRLLLARLLLRRPGHRQMAYAQLEAAVPELVHRPALACQAMLLLATPLPPNWPVQQHQQWAKRAGAHLPTLPSGPARVSLTADRALTLLALGETSGWQAAAQLPRSGSTRAERCMIANGHLQVGQLAIDWGAYPQARTQLARAKHLIGDTGFERLRNIADVTSAYVDWCTGQWSGLGATAAALAGAAVTEPLTIRLHAQQIQGLIDLASGRPAAARSRLRAVLDTYLQLELVGPEAATAAAALGRLHLAEQDTNNALQATAPVMTMIARKGVWLWAADLAPVHLDALVANGELRRAEDLTRQFVEWIAGRDVPAAAAAGMLCQAILAHAHGDVELAVRRCGEAADAWAALPHPYYELLTLERYGRCRLATDGPDGGAEILTEASRRLRKLGARWDAARISRQLRQHGIVGRHHVGAGTLAYGEHLTPREVDVLTLVSRGATNDQVARELVLSPRTVAAHLSRAMRKLQVTNRTAAVVAAAEAGLIPTPTKPVADDMEPDRPVSP